MVEGDSSASDVVTEIWYSLSLSEKTYNYLCSALQGLLGLKSAEDLKSATGGLVSLNENHFKEFEEIWRRWLDLRVEGTSNIRKQREKVISEDPSSSRGKINYYRSIPREHLPTAEKYMEDGIFKRTMGCQFAENPTLTGPSFSSKDGAFTYCCPGSVFPFAGWDYIEVAKLMHTDSIVVMFGNYIECKLRSFMEKLSFKQVRFEIILGDCMNIEELLNKEQKYDRISTSNLMDYILLPDLLRVYSVKLNRCNPSATLITESVNWHLSCPEADVSKFPSETPEQTAYFREIVMLDTKNPTLANGSGTTFREYLDNSKELQDYLRVMFYIYSKRQEAGTSLPSRLPNFKGLGNEFQLRLRDCFRNENRIVFFKQAVNRRRVTMITGLERYMEWVPITNLSLEH